MALEQAGIRPDIIAGVSAGSVVAAMYAAGLHPRKILEIFMGGKFSSFTNFAIPKSGLFSLDPFRDFLRSKIPVERLEDMRIPTIIGTTNFDTGLTENFSEGPTADIVTASCCIPIVFTPRIIGQYHYVDGGVLHNLPSRALREKCQTLIGINCSPVKHKDTSANGLFDTALRAYNLVAKSNAVPDLELCDIQISIDRIADVAVFDLSASERIFAAGYEAALTAIKVAGIGSSSQRK